MVPLLHPEAVHLARYDSFILSCKMKERPESSSSDARTPRPLPVSLCVIAIHRTSLRFARRWHGSHRYLLDSEGKLSPRGGCVDPSRPPAPARPRSRLFNHSCLISLSPCHSVFGHAYHALGWVIMPAALPNEQVPAP